MADNFPINNQNLGLLAKYLTPFTGGDGRYREYIYESSKTRLLSMSKIVHILGAGPSGLVVASELASRGYKVSIYEKNNISGACVEHGNGKIIL